MTPDPVLLKIGPLTIYWYGFLIMVGVVLAALVAAKLAKEDGRDPEHVWSALVWCLIFGVLGARLYHVIHKWDYYSAHLGEIFGLSMAGFGIYGAVLGGMLGMFIYARRHKLSFLRWADYAFVGVPLAQALGRWGNFFNQELFGYPTDLPWGIQIDHSLRDYQYPQFADYDGRFHPTFLYESLWCLLTFGILWFVSRRYRRQLLPGDVGCLYGMLYPLGRFFTEFQRPEPDLWRIGGIPTAQVIAMALFLFCGAVLVYRHFIRKPKPAVADVSEPAGEAEDSSVSDSEDAD